MGKEYLELLKYLGGGGGLSLVMLLSYLFYKLRLAEKEDIQLRQEIDILRELIEKKASKSHVDDGFERMTLMLQNMKELLETKLGLLEKHVDSLVKANGGARAGRH